MHLVGRLPVSNLSEFPHHQLLPQRCYHVTELSCSLITKGFKGFYCPLRHIRTPAITITDAHYEKKMTHVIFNVFFHAYDTEYIMP